MPPRRRPIPLLLLAALAAACGGGGGTAAPAPADPATLLTIAAVGDTIGAGLPDGDPLGDVATRIGDPDLFLFNHEGVSRDATDGDAGCAAFPDQSLFLSPPDFLDALRLGPHPVATLANNHVLDCGEDGLAATLVALADRGIGSVGAGADAEAAAAPAGLVVNGVRVGIAAFLAEETDLRAAGPATAGAASWFAHDGPGRVAALAAESDLVIVALHLHVAPGWTEEPAPESLAVVTAAIEAGADLVVAHGPHVPQGVLVRDGRLALLSLGNFLFRPDYALSEPARRSVVARVAVEADALDLTLVPLRLDGNGRPRVPAADDAREMLDRLQALSAKLGTRLVREGDTARIRVPGPHLFFRGAEAHR